TVRQGVLHGDSDLRGHLAQELHFIPGEGTVVKPAQAQDSERTIAAHEGNVTQRTETFGDGQVAGVQPGQGVCIEGNRLTFAKRAASRAKLISLPPNPTLRS